MHDPSNPGDSAFRPLRSVREDVASLRGNAADPETRRKAVLRIASAVDGSLRRLLRDDEGFPLRLRLRALAPDELSIGDVIAELRQRDRISIELAATVHELMGTRRRLTSGENVTAQDAALAREAAERLEVEIGAAPAAAPRAPTEDTTQLLTPEDEDDFVRPVPRASRRRAEVPPWVWAASAAALLLILIIGVWWGFGRRGGDAGMQEGIALFRSGEMAQAATLFRQYADRNPDDPTPRLYLARIYRRQGQFTAASDELRRAIEIAPEDPALHRELGFLLLDVGRPDVAAARFRTAVELDPEATDAWIGLVRALRASGQHDAAERVISRAPAEVRALAQ